MRAGFLSRLCAIEKFHVSLLPNKYLIMVINEAIKDLDKRLDALRRFL
jgi:hypothetical protein